MSQCWTLPARGRDGGRDGIGGYQIGMSQNYVTVAFAMEAKCYEPNSGLGVTVISRLISRLRHRQFGVLVTTSFLARQAYEAIVEDQHPIIVCSGGDVAELLITKVGVHTVDEAREWLARTYPVGPQTAIEIQIPPPTATPMSEMRDAVSSACRSDNANSPRKASSSGRNSPRDVSHSQTT